MLPRYATAFCWSRALAILCDVRAPEYARSAMPCGSRRRKTGFLPSKECSECRIILYRCERCGERSEVTVCNIMELESS